MKPSYRSHLACPLARCIALVLALLAALLLSGEASAQKTRGTALTEQRIALVIGNAAYRVDPLDNPVNDARLVAESLQRAGFKVTRQENLDRAALFNALRDFGNRLNENTVAVVYYAGHGLQLRDRNYLIPIEAELRSEDEIPISGVDLSFILGRMSSARSRINVVILDACRNNPFAGKTVAAPQGLAQMDAPVGTLLAFATAPGKLAADSAGGANSAYATHLARHILTPGLPVELVFKRVREGVVRDTKGQQVPWESSSLQGEFAFVPGMASPEAASEDASGELAFWNSVQAGNRAEEYRAYLRQYPNGRFATLAQSRLAALQSAAVPPPRPATQTAAAQPGAAASASSAPQPQAAPPSQPAPSAPPQTAAAPPQVASPQAAAPPVAQALPGTSTARPELLPRAGDTWRYRVQDQFRIGDLFVTAKVDAVTAEGVAETWTTTSDGKVRTMLAPLEPGFNALPSWNLTPPEFAPYLQALGPLRLGQKMGEQERRFEQATVLLRPSVEGEEEVVVGAGKFRAMKLVLRGQGQSRGTAKAGTVSAEHTIWYAPEVKRPVKYSVSTRVGGALKEATTFELVEFAVH